MIPRWISQQTEELYKVQANIKTKTTPVKRLEVPLAQNTPRQERFLEALSLYGVPTYAAKAASPHAKGSCLRTFSDLRDRDPKFATRWREAENAAHERIKTAAMDRGVYGIDDVVVQGGKVVKDDDGNVIVKKVYSDKILDRLLQRFPEFNTRKIEHSGSVEHRSNEGRLFIGEGDLYALGLEQRRQLVSILNTISETRGESMAVDRIHAMDVETIEPDSTVELESWELVDDD